ncbi:hypothetical protein BaRGS_00015747 [Batillaria attramentaria]|uniref:Uncharacterized protein n=1 Tax=Batillaria attramentaria TaxID=370345 RepID=A0ABD0L1R7_9CAEN
MPDRKLTEVTVFCVSWISVEIVTMDCVPVALRRSRLAQANSNSLQTTIKDHKLHSLKPECRTDTGHSGAWAQTVHNDGRGQSVHNDAWGHTVHNNAHGDKLFIMKKDDKLFTMTPEDNLMPQEKLLIRMKEDKLLTIMPDDKLFVMMKEDKENVQPSRLTMLFSRRVTPWDSLVAELKTAANGNPQLSTRPRH